MRTLRAKRRHIVVVSMVFSLLAAIAGQSAVGTISTFVGGGVAPVILRDVVAPSAVVSDAGGNLYVADQGANVVRRYQPGPNGVVEGGSGSDDIMTVVAGNYKQGTSGDGGQARHASLNTVTGIALGPDGSVYIADYLSHKVRKVSPGADGVVAGASDETITTVAGSGYKKPANSYDCAGDAYCELVCLFFGGCDQVGTGDFTGDGGAATAARLNFPTTIAVDATGNLYIADSFNGRIRKVDTSGIITTFAGTSCDPAYGPGYCYGGDGGPATAAKLARPYGVAVDGTNVLIADSFNNRIRQVDSTGTITTVAGDGFIESDPNSARYFRGRHAGDGGPATSGSLDLPRSVTVSGGNMYISDTFNQRVRLVSAGTITTLAGNGSIAPRPAAGAPASGDGGSATAAALSYPSGVAVTSGGAYIADIYTSRIRRVSSGTITSAAGDNRLLGCCGDDNMPGNQADVFWPQSIVTSGTTTYISDTALQRVLKVDGTGMVTTYAGNGNQTPVTYPPSPRGDGGPARSATFSNPVGLAANAAGDLFVADASNQVIRKIDVSTGIISTAVGGGPDLGDGVSSTSAALVFPTGVTFDSAGNMYIADAGYNKVRKVDTSGIVTTVAGTGPFFYNAGYDGDGGPGNAAHLNKPRSVAVKGSDLYISDSQNNVVRRVDLTSGIISTVVGLGAPLLSPTVGPIASTAGPFGAIGDGLPASKAGLALSLPSDYPAFGALGPLASEMAFDSAGNMYIADTWNQRIRKIVPGADGVITGADDELISTAAGTGCTSIPPIQLYTSARSAGLPGVNRCGFSETGSATAVNLRYPTGVAMRSGNLLIADSNWGGVGADSNNVYYSRVRQVTGL